MTQRNKLIVGAVVVLGAYYLYDRNKKMQEVARLKAQVIAEAQAEALADANRVKKIALIESTFNVDPVTGKSTKPQGTFL
jgi:hypothetical protein